MARSTLSQSKAFVEFVSRVEGKALTIGLDVHKNSYDMALLSDDGASWACSGPAGVDWILRMIRDNALHVRLVAYEAGPTGFSAARSFLSAGIKCIVAAPAQIPRPASTGAKTDRLDCQRLARLAAHGMLHPVTVPTPEEEASRDLVRRRHDLVKSLRNVKLRIRSKLLYWGVAEPRNLDHWSRKALEALETLELLSACRQTLQSLLRELSYVQNELRIVELDIAKSCTMQREGEILQNLQTVPGVGPVVSATFHREIFRPERFPRGEELGRYLGLSPVPRQSGESKGRARRIPSGQKVLRGILVQAAWRWRSADSWASEYYNRILSHCGLAQKAITALARKLAIILWRIILENRPYRQNIATS